MLLFRPVNLILFDLKSRISKRYIQPSPNVYCNDSRLANALDKHQKSCVAWLLANRLYTKPQQPELPGTINLDALLLRRGPSPLMGSTRMLLNDQHCFCDILRVWWSVHQQDCYTEWLNPEDMIGGIGLRQTFYRCWWPQMWRCQEAEKMTCDLSREQVTVKE